jgi:hypothetical protein
MNLVSGAKDEWGHFGVPESGLVAKVHAGGQHVSHTYSHFFISGLTICSASQVPTSKLLMKSLSTREPVSKQAIFYRSRFVYTAPLSEFHSTMEPFRSIAYAAGTTKPS